jgi:hypothetical protein
MPAGSEGGEDLICAVCAALVDYDYMKASLRVLLSIQRGEQARKVCIFVPGCHYNSRFWQGFYLDRTVGTRVLESTECPPETTCEEQYRDDVDSSGNQ